SLLISGAVARLVDPICRAEITRMGTADRGWGRLLDHLAAAGPSSIEDLRTELGLKRQELKALRAPLERCGAIVSRSLHVTAGQGDQRRAQGDPGILPEVSNSDFPRRPRTAVMLGRDSCDIAG